MRESARVTSTEAIERFRHAIITFGDEAGRALASMDADLARTKQWINHDARSHWKRQIQRYDQEAKSLKLEILRVETGPAEYRRSMVTERKAHDRARRRCDEAAERLRAAEQWGTALEREILLYHGQSQQLSSALTGDLGRCVARLDRAISDIQAYLDVAPPPSAVAPSSGLDRETDDESARADTRSGASMARPLEPLPEEPTKEEPDPGTTTEPEKSDDPEANQI